MDKATVSTLVDQLVITVQKTKSNMVEAIAGRNEPTESDKMVLALLTPQLFDQYRTYRIDEALLRYQAKKDSVGLEPIDLYNMLYILDNVPSIRLIYGII